MSGKKRAREPEAGEASAAAAAGDDADDDGWDDDFGEEDDESAAARRARDDRDDDDIQDRLERRQQQMSSLGCARGAGARAAPAHARAERPSRVAQGQVHAVRASGDRGAAGALRAVQALQAASRRDAPADEGARPAARCPPPPDPPDARAPPQEAVGTSSERCAIILAALAKMFVGDLVETARAEMSAEGESGPIPPHRLRAAYELAQRRGVVPQSPSHRTRLFWQGDCGP